MATDAEIRKVIGHVEEYAREDEVDVPVEDFRLEIRRLDLEEKKLELEVGLEEKKLEMGMKERLLGMFSDGKLTYDQMREMMG